MELKQLKLQQLIIFRDVVEGSSFTKAAKKNYTSQSNISYAIKELEMQLGFPLFERNEKNITLTEKGRQAIPYVKKILISLEDFMGFINGEDANAQKQIRIAYANTLGKVKVVYNLLHELVQNFSDQNTHISLISTPWTQAISGNEAAGMEAVLEKDLASMGLNWGVSNSRILSFLVGYIDLYLALPLSHPLAKRDVVCLENVQDERFSFLGYDNYLYHYYQNMFEMSHLPLREYEKNADWTAILNYVRAGTCLTIMPKLDSVDDNYIKLIPIEHPMAKRPIYLSWNKDRQISEETEMIRRYILRYFRDQETAL